VSNIKQVTVSAQDIDSTAQRLEEFSRGLSPNEQVVVDWLLERSASAPPTQPDAEVVGYLAPLEGLGTPVSQQPGLVGGSFNRALGLQAGNVDNLTLHISGDITIG
jgi:hypothetical protein